MQNLCRALLIAAITIAAAAAQQGKSAIWPARSRPNHTPGVRCDDVAKLDSRNLTILTAQRAFAFHNGIAVNYDWPPAQDAEHAAADWEAEIEKDTIIRPEPNGVVRFLIIHDSHATGSGWRYYATGFRCSDGKMREVFHRDGASLSVDRLDSSAITIGLNTREGDPVRTTWSYIWDSGMSK